MFCHKQNYLQIEKIQKKTLKIIYKTNKSYDELLILNNEVLVHQKCWHVLTKEVYKSLADINSDFRRTMFYMKTNVLQLTKKIGLIASISKIHLL